ncbi:MAG: YihY/virulence factor BrkB family protein [Candidatus Symbiothrix sp.]|jgi:membrane protein|nr:YihY/virulence factor BrkB family protein [Candidatus Symbiothrix sp.]
MKLKSIPEQIKQLVLFVTGGIWRILPQELTKKKRRNYTILKVIILAVKRYQAEHLQQRASALTYSTFLSLIPLLAVLVAIAKGFGFQTIVESQLFEHFPGQQKVIGEAFTFVDSYLAQSQNGIFLGIGLVMLLYTVFNLISTIENSFNQIWQIKHGRSYWRRMTDYFSGFFLIPVLLVCSSGVSILYETTFGGMKEHFVLAPIYEILLMIGPLIFSIILFTGLYLFLPNTKVQLKNALAGGIFAAIGFQVFQFLYISGQMWVSKYNAIYGSFAFIPLLLLWMQLSWVICLCGAEIAFACQNVENYDYEQETKNISRRYLDFLTLSIASLILKRFETTSPPYTAIEISNHFKLPIRLVNKILNILIDIHIINEVKDVDAYPNYQPAIDSDLITVRYVLEKIDQYGTEDFKTNYEQEFAPEWETILQTREDMFSGNGNRLVKNC